MLLPDCILLLHLACLLVKDYLHLPCLYFRIMVLCKLYKFSTQNHLHDTK